MSLTMPFSGHAQDPTTNQRSSSLLEYIAGAPDALTAAGPTSDVTLTTARQLEEIQQRACGRVSEQADAIAGFTLACPSLLSPLETDLRGCDPLGRPMAMRHLVAVARHSANDPSCTAAKVAGDQITTAARLWDVAQWPTASEHPAYDTEFGQRWDPRMMPGYAWSMGERDANMQSLLLDTSLALWAAESSLTLYNLAQETQLIQEEQRRREEAVPAPNDPSSPGAAARRTACGIFRANLAELDGRVPDAVLAPLAFAAQNPSSSSPYVPLCHLPPEFSDERMVELLSVLDTTTLRRAPEPLKAWAIQGASEYFIDWAYRSVAQGSIADAVALSFLRVVDDLADHYLDHHRDNNYNPDLEVPLNADMLNVALNVLGRQGAAPDYAAIKPVVIPSLIAALYVMERDELRMVQVNLAPDAAGGEVAAELRTPGSRWVVPWQVPASPTPASDVEVVDLYTLDEQYQMGGSAFEPEAPFSAFCKELAAGTLAADSSKEDLSEDAREILENYDAQAEVIADLRAVNWADKSCAAFAPESSASIEGEVTVTWRVARSTYYMVVAYPDLTAAVRDLIPGDGPNVALSPKTAQRDSAPDARECVWTEKPARDVIEALGLDRVGSSLHGHARQALHANGAEVRAFREAATRAYACEAAWMEANDLHDFARFVNQKTTIPGAPACERRRPVDIEPSRGDTTGRVTYVAVRKFAHPMRHLGELAEDQVLAGVLMNDVLGRAGAATFPINECSAWELEDEEGGQILVGVRAPMGAWTEIREDGITKAWNFEVSPTWNPPRNDIDTTNGGVDPEDRLASAPLSAGADRRHPSSPHRDTPSSSKNALVDTRRSWLLASGVGAGIAGVTLLTDGGIRLGRNATLYGSTLDAQPMLTPVQYADDLHTARSGQLVGGVELIAGAALAGTSVWCLSTLVNHNLPISQREQEYGLTLAATWLPANGGFIAIHAPIGGARD